MHDTKIKQEKILGKRNRIDFLGVSIDSLTMGETVQLVEKYVQTKTPLHLMGVNADKINETNKNPLMKQIVNSCGIINADGASVILASKRLNCKLPERVAGIDLMQNLVELSAKKGYRIYLLGAKQEIVEKTAQVLKTKYKNLEIAGIRNGYFKESDWQNISDELKNQKPDLVFVGITSPKKEYLIEFLQSDGNNCIFMGVGGSFDVISGNIPRAPKWMQKMNLEWLFRMIKEPRRLFKRYIVGNTTFMLAVSRAKRKATR